MKYKSKNKKLLEFGGGYSTAEGTFDANGNKVKGPNGTSLSGEQSNANQYAQIGTSLAYGAVNTANNFDESNNASIRQKSESLDGATVGVASVINPAVGAIIDGVNTIAKPIRTNLEKTDSSGNLINPNGAKAGYVAGAFLDPIKALSTRASYKGGFTDFSGNAYTKALENEAKSNIDPNYIDPAQQLNSTDTSQHQYKMGGRYKCEDGGDLTEYVGDDHTNGGIPVGNNIEVEGGENQSGGIVNSKSYIYNKHLAKGLLMNGIDITKYIGKDPAKAARMEEKRYPRENDPYTQAALAQEEKNGTGKYAIQNASKMIGDMLSQNQIAKFGGKLRWGGDGKWIPDGPFTDEYAGLDKNRTIGSYTPNKSDSISPYITPQEQDKINLDYRNSQTESTDMGGFSPSVNDTNWDSNPKTEGNKFNPNSLYNLGNFAGAAYDIGRGLKGGDKVKYDRVTPSLVDYSASRDINRRDIKEGFANTQKQLKNINSPAQYLNLITQTAGQRDKAISDQTAKSFENEANTNAGLANQGKYFNAGTQRAESDAQQMEKDIASNTLSTGLYNAGMAFSQMGSDKNMSEEDRKAIEAINSKYRNQKYNKKTGKYTYTNSDNTQTS